MKKRFPISLGSVLILSVGMVQADPIAITLDAATLASWGRRAETQVAAQPDGSLLISAGSQIARTIPKQTLILRMVSSPNFSAESADWPILEIGSVALALVRSGETNQLALIAGESAPVNIPLPSGAADNLEIALAIDPLARVGVVSVGGNLTSFSYDEISEGFEAVLTAGEHSAWSVQQLEILLLDESTGEESTRAQDEQANRLKTALEAAKEQAHAAQPAVVASGNLGLSPKEKPSDSAAVNRPKVMKALTPSSVRHGRALALRAKLATQK